MNLYGEWMELRVEVPAIRNARARILHALQ